MLCLAADLEDSATAENPDLRFSASTQQIVIMHRDAGMRLGISLMRKWSAALPQEELREIVDLALCEAAVHYCPERGTSFTTFLFYHLRGRLLALIKSRIIEQKVKHAAQTSVSNESLSASMRTPSPEEFLLRQEKRALLAQALLQLEPVERIVLEELYFAGKKRSEISQTLGLPLPAFICLQKRALRHLREVIDHKSNSTCEKRHPQELFALKNRYRRRQALHRKKRITNGLPGLKTARRCVSE